ncbi:POTE ankyrin domain family member A [Manis javanica]|nr:POTE ankyrin domain family member A [Manis javanica]
MCGVQGSKRLCPQRKEREVSSQSHKKQGLTPLLLAVSETNYQMVKYFLMEGANVHAVDCCKRTALMLAAERGASDIARLLLQQDIDLFAQDIFGWTVETHAHLRDCDITPQMFVEVVDSLEVFPKEDLEITSVEEESPDGSEYNHLQKIEHKYLNKQDQLKKYIGKQEYSEERLSQLQRENELLR